MRCSLLLWISVVVGFTLAVRISDGPSNGLSTKTSFACEGSSLTIDCGPTEDLKISVVRANYGRQIIDICYDGGDTSSWNIQCISTRALSRVADMCNGLTTCEVQATNRLFGDPCYLTPKYLEIQFQCQDASKFPEEPTTLSSTSTTTTTTPAPSTTTTLPTTPVPTTTTATTTTTITTTPTTTPKPTTTPTPKPKPTLKTNPPKPPELKDPTTKEPMQGDQGRPKTHCDAQFVRGIQWPRHPKGAWAILDCPNNPSEKAFWRCSPGPDVDWEGKPDLSDCESQELLDLGAKLALAKEEFSSEIITEVSSELQQTSSRQDLYGGDIKAMSHIMEDMVKEVDKQAKNTSKPITKRFIQNVTDAVLTTSSNMLAEEKKDSWTDLPQATQAETATRVISTVEESAYQAADTYTEPTIVVNVTLNIVLEVNVIDTRSAFIDDVMFPHAAVAQKPSQSDWFGGGNSIRLSGNSIRDMGIDGLAKVLFLTYNNLEKYLNPESRPVVTTTTSETIVELEGREEETFDPSLIEFEPMNPVVETGPYNVNYDNVEAVEIEEVLPESSSTTTTTTTTSTTTQSPTTTPTTTTTTQPPVLNDPPSKNTTKIVNSQIISASVLQKEKDKEGKDVIKKGHLELSEPVLYTLEHKTTNNVYNPTCSFWEYSEKTLAGHWSTFGCRVKDTNVTHTTCSCNHITNFAVLMDVHSQEISDGHEFALAFITYLGCIISAVCLLLCFLSFACFKNLQCDRNTIHKNLVLCLLIAEVLFLTGIMQYKTPIACSVIAALLHYFFLAAFLWMLLEGVQLYVMLVEVFEAEKSRVKYYYLIAYGGPALVVGISAAVDHTGYGTEKHCWLSAENGFIWAFVGPVVAIISVNIVMLSIAIYQMCKHADAAAAWKMKQKSKMENVRSWVKGASVLVVLLGLTWTFGLLYVDQHSLFMAYIFTILNSLQGLFIFIFHCAMNEKVQKEYKRCVRHASWLPESLRVKYGGAKPYASTSPNQSSSSGNKSQKTTKTTPEAKASLEYLTRLISGRRRKRSSTATARSSLSNPTRSGPVYQNMNQEPISPRESTLLSSPVTSGPVPLNSSSVTGGDDGYLEPISARYNDHLLSEMDAGPMDFSTMEGSCVDTDYYGIDGGYSAPLDVDKYKIKLGNLSDVSEDKRSACSNDSDLKCPAEDSRLMNDYEEIMPRTKSEAELMERLDNEHYDSILERKLRQFAEEERERMNNLNKGDNEAQNRDSVALSTPNITGSTLKRGQQSRPSENAQYGEVPQTKETNNTLLANQRSRPDPVKQLIQGKSMPTSRC